METKTAKGFKAEIISSSDESLPASYDPKKPTLPSELTKWLGHMVKHSKTAPTYIMFYTKKGQMHIYPMPGFTVVDSEVGPEAPHEIVKVVVENPNWVETSSGWRKIC